MSITISVWGIGKQRGGGVYDHTCIVSLFVQVLTMVVAWSMSWRPAPPLQLLLLAWYLPVYPAGSLSCVELERRYGPMLRYPPFSEASTPYLLHTALTTRRPTPLRVSQKVVAQWWRIHRPGGGPDVSSAQDFETRYGGQARALQPFPTSAYRLCAALRERDPPIFVTDGILTEF